jgi:hypothetical protein
VNEPRWQFHSNPKTVLKVLKVFLRSPDTHFTRETLKARTSINADWLCDCLTVLLEQERIKIVRSNKERFYKLAGQETVAITKEEIPDRSRSYSELLGVWWQDLQPTLRGSSGSGYLRPSTRGC